ncbi:hypothetical protein SAMN05444411_102417 [Lutibacter oricola]|uniref:Uncharacterized protein n=1 Tax=Lutibacter oricola TaxID=762486 RepID=A0A1H2XAL5_9FLAO|nr:hypothetical protein [Lutibacter oricola]SDW89880.1 hypothetical protein SAMN05444411_102417 [Lutibacter oricola]
MKNKYSVGSIVTFKTHPLFNDFRIQGDGKYVPPVMMVKEVFIENNKKRTHDEETGKKISDKVKYTCVYFDDDKSQFTENTIYESFLRSYKKLKIERISEIGELRDDTDTIIKEIKSYFKKPLVYKFGGIVRFITKKIEIYKKRSSKKITEKKGEIEKDNIKSTIQYVVNYASPDFVMCGLKKNDDKNLFYENGQVKKQVSETLLKVKWFNPIQKKFSEQFLPIEFFTDRMNFKSEVLEEELVSKEVTPNQS